MIKSPKIRFCKYINKDLNTGCWIWTGAIQKKVGIFNYKYKSWSARRWAWTHLGNKSLLESQVLVSTCKSLDCVNPEHMEAIVKGSQRYYYSDKKEGRIKAK
jgi:hypothetical protein